MGRVVAGGWNGAVGVVDDGLPKSSITASAVAGSQLAAAWGVDVRSRWCPNSSKI